MNTILKENTVNEEPVLGIDNIQPDNSSLSWRERICYGIGSIPGDLVMIVIGSYLMIYMTNVAFLDMAILSAIIAVSKCLDGISDIIIGNIIDNTKSKFGKARVWILRICVPLALSLLLIFFVPTKMPVFAKYIYFFVLYNITYTCLNTFYLISHSSLLSLCTNNGYEHGMLANIKSLLSGIFNFIVSITFMPLLIFFSKNPENPYTQEGFTPLIIIMSVIIIIGSLITVFGTEERVKRGIVVPGAKTNRTFIITLKALLKNKYWITMAIIPIIQTMITSVQIVNIYYATYVLKSPGSVSWMTACLILPGLIIKVFIPALARRMDNFGILKFGTLIELIGSIGLAFAPTNRIVLIVFLSIKGIGFGIVMSFLLGVIADTIKYTEKKEGIFAAGLGNAGISAARKIGGGLGTVILGIAMSAAGFDAAIGITQSQSVLNVSSFFFVYAPIITNGIILVILSVIFTKNCDIRQK